MAVERAVDGDIFIEVGCFLGKSAAYLAQKVKQSGKKITIYAVDIFEPECKHHADVLEGKDMLVEFRKNMKALDVTVIPIRGKSETIARLVADNRYSLVFIDAAHDYDAVKTDLNSWWPKVKAGGIFAGHDYFQDCGVPKAVDEFVKEKELKLELKDSCWLIIK